jgi:hypothetical protein
MEFNKLYLLIISILGLLLLYSYYYFFNIKKSNFDDLWGRIDRKSKLHNFYLVSMCLAALGFMLMLYYFLVSYSFSQSDITQLFILSLLIVVISMIWMPLSLEYVKYPRTWLKILIIIVLLVIAFSSLYTIIKLYMINETRNKISRNLAILGMIYFFFHTFFLDTIIWTTNFF